MLRVNDSSNAADFISQQNNNENEISSNSLSDNILSNNSQQPIISENTNTYTKQIPIEKTEIPAKIGLENFTAQIQKHSLDTKNIPRSYDDRKESTSNKQNPISTPLFESQSLSNLNKATPQITLINKKVVSNNVSTIKSRLNEIAFPNNPKPLEIGKARYQAERDIISTLKNTKSDTDLLATLTTLEQNKVLKGLFQSIKNPDNRRELLNYLGSKTSNNNIQTNKAIENTVISHIESLGEDAQIHFNLGRLGLIATKSSIDYTQYKYVVSSDPSAPFTGSGATGINPTKVDIPIKDQFNLFYEKKLGRGSDYKNGKASAEEAPTTAQYSNPLDNKSVQEYVANLSPQERQAQVNLLLSQPISSVFAESYGSQLPTRIDVIKAAAKTYNLEPELIASLLLAEQRDQSKNEDAVDYQSADKTGYDSSIGFGQIKLSTLKKNDLLSDLILRSNREKLTPSQTAKLLASDEVNIFAVAKYVRKVIDTSSSFPKEQAAFMREKGYLPSLDMSVFLNSSAKWPADNIRALGSEYSSKPWDGQFILNWGDGVYEAYKDVKNSNIFKE